MQSTKLLFNGKLLPNHQAIIEADNRGFRYADGFFETMKMVHGQILLAPLHFQRLFATLNALQFHIPKHFTANELANQIAFLAQKNQHTHSARIRLTIVRGNGGLYDPDNHQPNLLIQTWALPHQQYQLNSNGLHTAIYSKAIKPCDDFSQFKTNNFFAYAMAANWAKQQQLNDAILLNSQGNIADSTIANVFIVQNDGIKTPNLQQGCIAGVMRQYLLQKMEANQIPVQQTIITPQDLLQATELFFTNSIRGIQWVKLCNNTQYRLQKASQLFHQFIQPLTE